MKRLRDRPSSSSASEPKALVRREIMSLIASESNGGLSNRQNAIRLTRKPREVEFLHKLHHWLSRGKPRLAEVQISKSNGIEKGSMLRVNYNHDKFMFPFLETKLVGSEFEENAVEIIGWLKNSEAVMIGVWGMGGVGKTALVQHIYNELIQDASLLWSIYWASGTQCESVYKLQERIAKCCGVDLSDEEDEMRRASKLHYTLAKMGNILFILDDMWEPLLPRKVGIPLGKNGCRIILTTRLLEVCQRMGCKDLVIRVKDLSDENEAWDLFVDTLGASSILTGKLRGVAESIVYQCHGLPLAIITMADRMRGEVDITEWRNTSYELKTQQQYDMKHKVFSKLKDSFDRLNDDIIQNCFLSAAIWIHKFDGRLDKRTLIDCWIYEGLLDKMPSKQNPLVKGNAVLNKLVNSCLLDSSAKIMIHPLIRDNLSTAFLQENQTCFATVKAKLEYIEEVLENGSSSEEDLVNVSLYEYYSGKDLSPKCSKLTMLVTGDRGSIPMIFPEPFFVDMSALTILDLSFANIKRLPESVCNLKNLRVLLLNFSKLKFIPSFAKLVNLRVLELWEVFSIEEAPVGMENMKSLERLCFQWNIRDLMHFNKFVESNVFVAMHSYHFILFNENFDWRVFEEYDTWHCGHKEVRIIGVKFSYENDAPLFPRNMESLDMAFCDITGRRSLVDALPSLGNTQNLKKLTLMEGNGLEYIFSTAGQEPHILPQYYNTLEVLSIDSLNDLREVIKLEGSEGALSLTNPPGPPAGGAFSNLKKLEIFFCHKIRNVFPFNLVRQSLRLSNLEEIVLSDCDNLEGVFEPGRVLNSGTGDGSTVLSKLRELRLSYLPKLASVCRGLPLCPSLSSLVIWDCDQIKEVFSLDLLQHIQTLKKIQVENCKGLGTIFESPINSVDPVLALPNLSSLVLNNLPKLSSVYRGLLLCTSLETIDISHCRAYPCMKGLSKPLICDFSPSTLASFPEYDANRAWWDRLIHDYPHDIPKILAFLHDFWRSNLSRFHQGQGPNSRSTNFQQTPSESDAAIANQGFPSSSNYWVNQNATQGVPNVTQPRIQEIPFVDGERLGIDCTAVNNFDNADWRFTVPYVASPGHTQYIDNALGSDQSLSYIPQNESSMWGGQHYRFGQ